MQVGDTVFIVSSDRRIQGGTGVQTISKIGRQYFEVEGNSWEKFWINPQSKKGSRQGVRTKDQYTSCLYWYSSEEEYKLTLRAREAREYISRYLHLLLDDEAIDIMEIMKERE